MPEAPAWTNRSARKLNFDQSGRCSRTGVVMRCKAADCRKAVSFVRILRKRMDFGFRYGIILMARFETCTEKSFFSETTCRPPK